MCHFYYLYWMSRRARRGERKISRGVKNIAGRLYFAFLQTIFPGLQLFSLASPSNNLGARGCPLKKTFDICGYSFARCVGAPAAPAAPE